MINALDAASHQVGLKINRSKTNVMTNFIKYPVYLENEALNYVDIYIYLRQLGLLAPDPSGSNVESRPGDVGRGQLLPRSDTASKAEGETNTGAVCC